MPRVLIPPGLALAGCGLDQREIGHEPRLTPAVDTLCVANVPPPFRAGGPASLHDINRGSLLRDPRAMTVGDVLTVNIAIQQVYDAVRPF
jgi:flagellar L-ring protein precursor FlgH